MQTALPVLLALTFPGSSTPIGRTASGLGGVMHEKNRWSVLVPLVAMFVPAVLNLLVVGPATTGIMRERKHQGERLPWHV